MPTARATMSDGQIQSVKIDRSFVDALPILGFVLTALVGAAGLFNISTRLGRVEDRLYEAVQAMNTNTTELKVAVAELKAQRVNVATDAASSTSQAAAGSPKE